MRNLTPAQWGSALVALALTVGALGWMMAQQDALTKSAAEGHARKVAESRQ